MFRVSSRFLLILLFLGWGELIHSRELTHIEGTTEHVMSNHAATERYHKNPISHDMGGSGPRVANMSSEEISAPVAAQGRTVPDEGTEEDQEEGELDCYQCHDIGDRQCLLEDPKTTVDCSMYNTTRQVGCMTVNITQTWEENGDATVGYKDCLAEFYVDCLSKIAEANVTEGQCTKLTLPSLTAELMTACMKHFKEEEENEELEHHDEDYENEDSEEDDDGDEENGSESATAHALKDISEKVPNDRDEHEDVISESKKQNDTGSTLEETHKAEGVQIKDSDSDLDPEQPSHKRKKRKGKKRLKRSNSTLEEKHPEYLEEDDYSINEIEDIEPTTHDFLQDLDIPRNQHLGGHVIKEVKVEFCWCKGNLCNKVSNLVMDSANGAPTKEKNFLAIFCLLFALKSFLYQEIIISPAILLLTLITSVSSDPDMIEFDCNSTSLSPEQQTSKTTRQRHCLECEDYENSNCFTASLQKVEMKFSRCGFMGDYLCTCVQYWRNLERKKGSKIIVKRGCMTNVEVENIFQRNRTQAEAMKCENITMDNDEIALTCFCEADKCNRRVEQFNHAETSSIFGTTTFIFIYISSNVVAQHLTKIQI